MRTATLAIMLTLSTAFCGAAEPLNLASSFGKTRSELKTTFPGDGNEVPDWNGFKKAYLFFSAKGQFNQVGLEFPAPVSEKEAMEAVKSRLGIDVSKFKPIVSRAAVRFEGIGGNIKSVTLKRDDPGSQIPEITITSTIPFD